MKLFFLANILSIVLSFKCLGQDTLQTKQDILAAPDAPQITFVAKEYNFGNTTFGKVVSQAYEFTNTGTKTLKILAIQAACDCTTVIWDKTPIEAGKTGKIMLIYAPKPNQIGEQRKVVLVISNALNKEELLYLKGSVIAP